MIKVFLAEDELVIREGIKNNICWEKEGFEFVGEASDGELAYSLIKKNPPDILITDIRMPFMDGLELSCLVKKELPDTKILILSGHGEFDYAKQAITIGVTEYLLKPISSQQLVDALKSIAEVIKKEREKRKLMEQYNLDMRENVQKERQRLFTELIMNQLSTHELLERGAKLELDFTSSAYAVMLFEIMQCSSSERYTYKEQQVIAAEEVIKQIDAKENILVFERGTEGWVFIVKGEDKEAVAESLRQIAKELKELVSSYRGLEFFGGIGSVIRRIGEIGNSYKQANKAFSSRFFTELNQMIYFEDVKGFRGINNEKIDLTTLLPSRMHKDKIENFLKNAISEEIEDFVNEYFMGIGEENQKSLMFRQYVTMDLFFSVASFLEKLGLSVNELSKEAQDINGIAARMESLESVKIYLRRLCTDALKLRDGQSMKKYAMLLEEAKEYIQKNYNNKNISLNLVASKVNISPSYFSTIFSQETGQTFIEFLTKVRLDKAKELLMCSNLKTAEIGYEAGYKDSHYFSYIFKKTQGCTPKEYRMRRKE